MMGKKMHRKRTTKLINLQKVTACLLCLLLIISYGGFLQLAPFNDEAQAAETNTGPTKNIVTGSRIADADTHDSYLSQLLGGDIYGSLVLQNTQDNNQLSFTTNGTRYAGRLWADKSVFANGDASGGDTSTNSAAWDPLSNELNLSIATDGFRGTVATDDDFLHVYSVLGSSQVQNVYPPNPIDLVIVFDMSGSMACAASEMVYGQTYRSVYENGNVPSSAGVVQFTDTNGETKYGITPKDRIKYSRIQATVDAINQTIDSLMEQNIQNRVAVVGYGASSAVLMPLHHYMPRTGEESPTGSTATQYIKVAEMQQLIPSDFGSEGGSYAEDEYGIGYFTGNVDGAYTLEVNAPWSPVGGEKDQEGNELNKGGTESGKYSNGFYGEGFSDPDTVYIGCLTSTQNGVYLGFKQLADTKLTTYEEQVNNTTAKLPRIPSLILMTDGGANFAYRNGAPQALYQDEPGPLSAQVRATINGEDVKDQVPDPNNPGKEMAPNPYYQESGKPGIAYALKPGDEVTYTFKWNIDIPASTRDITMTDSVFYIPINWVFDSEKIVISSISQTGKDLQLGRDYFIYDASGNDPILGFDANYYDYDKYIKINLGAIQNEQPGTVTVKLKVKEDLNGDDGLGVQDNGGFVTMRGVLQGHTEIEGFKNVNKLPACNLALSVNGNQDAQDYFASDWNDPIGWDNINKGNNGDEWYNYYLPGGESHSLNANSSRSVPNNQLWSYSWMRDGIFSTYPAYGDAGVLYQTDGTGDQQASVLATPGTTLEVLMTASYMKTAAQKNYQNGWENAKIPDSALTTGNNVVKVFSVGVDLGDTSFWSRARLYATMNPSEYFTDKLTSDSGADLSVLGSTVEGSAGIKTVNNKAYEAQGGENASEQQASIYEIQQAYQDWKEWCGGESIAPVCAANVISAEQGQYSTENNAGITLGINIKRIPDGGFDYTTGKNANGGEEPTAIVINNGDVEKHINYTDQFYDVSSEEVGGIFQQIIALIQGQIFNPVQGVNATGAKDSVTYFDPVGKYMEVKNPFTSFYQTTEDGEPVSSNISADIQMVHLGRMYGLVRTGVYDFHWNDDYMNAQRNGNPDTLKDTPMPNGWYYETGSGAATAYYGGSGSVPVQTGESTAAGTSFTAKVLTTSGETQEVQLKQLADAPFSSADGYPQNAQEAWSSGWTYRFGFTTTQQYVPTLNDASFGNLEDIQKNTVFTIYRFAWVQQSQSYAEASNEPYYFGSKAGEDGEPSAGTERQTWLLNPAYAESAKAAGMTWKKTDLGYEITSPSQEQINADVAANKDAPVGAYRISDFRVWVEDSGDFVSEGSLAKDKGYDEALYFNLPSAAIPLQLADLTVDTAGSTLEYLTNLGGENDNFELIQWDPENQGAEGATGHSYTITFTGKPLSYLAKSDATTPGGHPNNRLNYLIIDNSTEGSSGNITATQASTGDIVDAGDKTTVTIDVELTGSQSLVVTNVPSGVEWTVQATGAGAESAIWTGDGLPDVKGDAALKGTTIASTSVVATYPAPGNEPAAQGGSSLTLQNRVVNAQGDATAQSIVPTDQTYPFTVKFTKGEGDLASEVPQKVSYINSTGEQREMVLSANVTPSFILNSGDSITFYGLPKGLGYEIVPATASENPITWIGNVTSDSGTATGTLTDGNTLVTAQYTDKEAVAYNQNYYYAQSTPCRLFYSVGVEDAVLYPSGSVNVGALDAEYISTHTETGGTGRADDPRYSRLYFISNWWDAANESTLKSGVPATTFSPAADNRYYVFQKNLPLYMTGVTGDTGQKLEEYILDGKENYVSKNGMSLTIGDPDGPDGDSGDGGTTYNAVTSITGTDKQLQADSWYYILIEYYLPSANGGGQFVQMALPRQGKQFGTSVNTDVGTDTTGKYLCWYNTETGTVQEGLVTKPDASTNPTDPANRWVIATSVGGLRTGNMENNRRVKAENNVDKDGKTVPGGPTQTAADYFYPTAASGTGSGTDSDEPQSPQFDNEINVYLGNNGKLYISDTKLLMTKLVVDPEDAMWAKAEDGEAPPLTFTEYSPAEGSPNAEALDTDYDFQVFVAGMTGYRSATVVSYDNWSGLWRQVISTIDARSNNQGLLLSSDGNTLAVVYKQQGQGQTSYIPVVEVPNAEGEGSTWYAASGPLPPDENAKALDPQPGTLYYVYLGSMDQAGSGDTETGQNDYRIYSDTENNSGNESIGAVTIYVENPNEASQQLHNAGVTYALADESHPVGTRVYSAVNAGEGEEHVNGVVLVPKQTVDSYHTEDNNYAPWGYDADKAQGGYDRPASFPLATLYLDQDYSLRSGVNIESLYTISTAYLTKPLFFGYKLNDAGYPYLANDPEKKSIIPDAEGNINLEGAATLGATDLYDQTPFTNVKALASNPNVHVQYNVPDSSVGSSHPNVYTQTQVAASTALYTLKSGEGLVLSGLGNLAVYRVTEKSDADADDADLVFGRNVQYSNYVDYTTGEEYLSSTGDLSPEPQSSWNSMPGNARVAGYYSFQNAGTTITSGGEQVEIPPATPPNYEAVLKIQNATNYVNGVDRGPNLSAYFDDDKGVYSIYGDTDSQEEAAHFFNAPFDPAQVSFKVSKAISEKSDSWEWPAGGFTFTVTPSSSNPQPDPIVGAKGYADGKVTVTIGAEDEPDPPSATADIFIDGKTGEALEFSEPGTYTYTVEEQVPNPTVAGWSYDPQVYTITFTVARDYSESGLVHEENPIAKTSTTPYPEFDIFSGDLGVVDVSITDSAGNVVGSSVGEILPFENKYSSDEVDVTLSAQKQLIGAQLASGEFTFALDGLLAQDEGEQQITPVPMPDGTETGALTATAENDATGGIRFPAITYRQAGTYYYKLYEQPVTDEPVVGDGNAYLVVVTVTSKDGNGKGPFSADVKYYSWQETWDGAPFQAPDSGTLGSYLVTGPVTFKNTQDLIVEKVVQGSELSGETFDFTLSLYDQEGASLTNGTYSYAIYSADGNTMYNAQGDPIDGPSEWTASQDNQGTLAFSLQNGQFLRLSGLPAGTTYTVSEAAIEDEGIDMSTTWSQGAYEANGNGTITPLGGPSEPLNGNGAIIQGEDLTTGTGASESVGVDPYNYTQFVNSTDEPAPLSQSLIVRKIATGEGAPADAEFSFRATFDPAPEGTYTGFPSSGAPQEFTGASASFTLKSGETMTFSGLPANTHYSVEELTEDGWQISWEGQEGTIGAGATATATATNTWSPATVNVSGTKELVGGELEEGQFQFTIVPDGGNPPSDPVGRTTVTNTASGTIPLIQNATYTEASTYRYTVYEEDPGDDRVTSDQRVYVVTVEVTDDGKGNLSAALSISPDDAIVFVNTLTTGSLTVTKVTSGEGFPADQEFSFTVRLSEPLDGEYGGVVFSGGVASFTLKAGESITFEGLPDGVSYVVTEDTTSGSVLTWEGQEGTITAGATATATATNTWSPATVNVSGTKVLEGADLAAGQFMFLITPDAANPTPDPVGQRTATNTAGGYIPLIENATYTQAGIYRYTVSEVAGTDAGISYDGTVYTITVTVADDGSGNLTATVDISPKGAITFTNTKKTPPDNPNNPGNPTNPPEDHIGRTGDTTNWHGPAAIATLAALVALLAGFEASRMRRPVREVVVPRGRDWSSFATTRPSRGKGKHAKRKF